MKIAQVSPLYESVPPKFYGGTERIVSYLTEELVELGHEVTLYASADSVTKAALQSITPRSLRLDHDVKDSMVDHVLLLERIFQDAPGFDIVHTHLEYLAFPLLRRMPCAHVATMHNRLDGPNFPALFREFEDEPVISISNSQRQPLNWANWQGTVYHGIPQNLYRLQEKPGRYLAFIGRISPEKRVDNALRIAMAAGLPLKIAAKIDKVDKEYFEAVVKPLLKSSSDVEFLGEIGEKDKQDFLGNALALLFPVEWPEPFGLVMIESMACGTPVVAHPSGAIPEVVDEGITGFIVGSVEQAAAAVHKIVSLDRRRCRRQFEQRFTARRMAEEYIDIYEKLWMTSSRSRASTIF